MTIIWKTGMSERGLVGDRLAVRSWISEAWSKTRYYVQYSGPDYKSILLERGGPVDHTQTYKEREHGTNPGKMYSQCPSGYRGVQGMKVL